MVINTKIAWKRSANKQFDLPQKGHNYVFYEEDFRALVPTFPLKVGRRISEYLKACKFIFLIAPRLL